jgi:hypothetical protein
MDDVKIAEIMGRGRGSVRHRREYLGLRAYHQDRNFWSDKEIRRLVELCLDGKTNPEIAEITGRSLYAVANMAADVGARQRIDDKKRTYDKAKEADKRFESAFWKAHGVKQYPSLKMRGANEEKTKPHMQPAEFLIDRIAKKHGLRPSALKSDSRQHHIVIASQEASYAIRALLKYSLPQIGKIMCRDHTTILRGIRKHAERNGLKRLDGGV